MVGELPPEVSDDGLDGATIDSSESTDDTSSSDPADESDEDGGQSLAESARCAGQCAGCPAPNMKSDVALIIAGEFGRCPKISVNDWLSSSLKSGKGDGGRGGAWGEIMTTTANRRRHRHRQ